MIGGSLIRAVRAQFPEARLTAWARREEVISLLRDTEGLGDEATGDISKAVEGADLIVLAMPTGAMADVIEQLVDFPLGSDVLVTDVGSVKGPVESKVGNLVRKKGANFIGSHPMAGSEKTGLKFADGELFHDAPVILTPSMGNEVEGALVNRLREFWEGVGARVSQMSVEEHDRLVASISHLPHLLAAALVRVVLGQTPEVGTFSGGGFRDTTRVSAGPEEMWTGILSDNSEAVSSQLGAFIEELESWKHALDTLDRDQLHGFLSQARKLRESL